MADFQTQVLTPDAAGIGRAAALLRAGQLVAFPTETVYGLGADARNNSAVARIFAAKNRPRSNPLIVHVADLHAAREIADFDARATRLAEAFWPGPLTLLVALKHNAGLSPDITAGLNTIAIRVPEHPLARDLLREFAGPVAAPSANPSGRLSPTSAAHVLAGLGGRIAAVLDGGACEVGVESTIIGLDPVPTLLRPGGLPAEIIEACLGQPLSSLNAQPRPSAPGQLAVHYAPCAALRLNAASREQGEVLLGFGAAGCDLNLSASGDLVEAAANLFHHLRALDDGNPGVIAVSPIPDHGLGRAINDRLRRAAAATP
ncbi:MAG: L-threonylcarbamoyladenylate synthase [Paracoccaceae bacterium]